MYSVEFIWKDDNHNCWDQYCLTAYRWSARLALLNLKLALGRKRRKKRKFRIREV